jgi:hypothetical protein
MKDTLKQVQKHIDDMTEGEAHKLLLSEISDVQDSISEQKRNLKRMPADRQRAAIERFEKTCIHFDALMMLKIQHELLSYIQEGGIPECTYHAADNLYAVSIPGANVLARINPNGLIQIRQFATEHDNPQAAKILRAQNEAPSHPFGDTSEPPSSDNIP